jgi:hypothetical protein
MRVLDICNKTTYPPGWIRVDTDAFTPPAVMGNYPVLLVSGSDPWSEGQEVLELEHGDEWSW